LLRWSDREPTCAFTHGCVGVNIETKFVNIEIVGTVLIENIDARVR